MFENINSYSENDRFKKMDDDAERREFVRDLIDRYNNLAKCYRTLATAVNSTQNY